MDGRFHCPFCDKSTKRINGCVTHLERWHKVDIEIFENNEKKKAKAKYYAQKNLAERKECPSEDVKNDFGTDLSSDDGMIYPDVELTEKQEQQHVKEKQNDERTEKEIGECIESVVNEDRSDILEKQVEDRSIVLRREGE